MYSVFLRATHKGVLYFHTRADTDPQLSAGEEAKQEKGDPQREAWSTEMAWLSWATTDLCDMDPHDNSTLPWGGYDLQYPMELSRSGMTLQYSWA